MQGFLRKVIAFLIASLIASWLLPLRGFAHGGPAPLDFWGDFPPAVGECQRIIGHATALCVNRVVRSRAACRLQEARGEACSTANLDAAIQAARSDARALVRSTCSEQEVQILRYIDVNEALTDLINVCRTLDTAVDSAAFAVVQLEIAPVEDEQALECLTAASSAVSKVLRASMRERRLVLDRIAVLSVPFAHKQALIGRATARIQQGAGAAAAALAPHCPNESFVALYGRAADLHLANVAAQADCFGGAVYVQDAVVCPAAVCGNAIREVGEACEDGNVAAGDGCSPTCRFEI